MGDKTKAADRRLLRKYGITLADYARLLEAQNGGCAICGRPPKPGRRFNVDHDHVLVPRGKKRRTAVVLRGSVRGLLCFYCNKFRIGHGATPDLLRAAADYLTDERRSLTQSLLLDPPPPSTPTRTAVS